MSRQEDACKWEADHQRAALVRLGLADEFPYGCDAIDFVGEALLAARNLLADERDKTKKLIDALQDIAVYAEEAKYMCKTAREALGGIGVELEKDEDERP